MPSCNQRYWMLMIGVPRPNDENVVEVHAQMAKTCILNVGLQVQRSKRWVHCTASRPNNGNFAHTAAKLPTLKTIHVPTRQNSNGLEWIGDEFIWLEPPDAAEKFRLDLIYC